MPLAAPDIRLIAVDMDGTLLDGNGRIPGALWPLLDQLRAAGSASCRPAGGSSRPSSARSRTSDDMVFIAENGGFVVRGEEEISSDAMDAGFTASVIRRLRSLGADGSDLGVVVCGKRSAYIERTDAAFHTEAERYYARLEVVDDLLAVDDQVLKLAVYDFGPAEATAPHLADLKATHQVVVSGHHWIDVMNQGVNKGIALAQVQAALGITAAQTMAFGDYLNDLELLDAAALLLRDGERAPRRARPRAFPRPVECRRRRDHDHSGPAGRQARWLD